MSVMLAPAYRRPMLPALCAARRLAGQVACRAACVARGERLAMIHNRIENPWRQQSFDSHRSWTI
jgi:hypothetical protein